MALAKKFNANAAFTNECMSKNQQSQTDTAEYIAEIILELRNLAKASEFNTLQGLLEISYYEAFGTATRIRIPEGEDEHLEEIGRDARKAAAVA